MKRRVPYVVLLTVAGLVSCQQDQEEVGVPLGPTLQAALDSSLENSGAVGVSVAVLFPDGGMWAGTAGVSHEGVPLEADMLFDIASVQKNLQAALALTLVEEGVFALDDPLEKWLPPMPHIDGAITIRQLLNLTSGIDGFVGDPESPFRVGYLNIDFEKTWTWEEIQDVFVDEPNFEPGTACEYSTTNYIVLRQVIERATHKEQSALLEDRLLKPNHLEHTLVDFSGPVPKGMRFAHGWFDTNGDGLADDISGRSLNWIASLSPMLVYSTPADMARWMDALYHRKTVFEGETVRAMLDFTGPVRGEPLMKGYGLGVVDINVGLMQPRWENVRVYGHLGSQYGYMAFVGYFPDHGVSMAVMSNRGGDSESARAITTVGGAVIDALLEDLGVREKQVPGPTV
jgi:D-alanyl-D-alanine carboxypeptidase